MNTMLLLVMLYSQEPNWNIGNSPLPAIDPLAGIIGVRPKQKVQVKKKPIPFRQPPGIKDTAAPYVGYSHQGMTGGNISETTGRAAITPMYVPMGIRGGINCRT